MTLAQAALGRTSLTKQALMVLGGSLFIALAAQISVPIFPVPMTLQTLAVLIVGLSYGSRLGALTVLTYLAEGAMGLPVFANAGNGAAFFGPTAGFLIGFVGLAWLVGFASERGLAKGVVSSALIAAGASLLLYVPGLAWPMALASAFGLEAGWTGQSFASYYWTYFMGPFLIGDMVKAALAALIVAGGLKALRAR